MRESGEFTYSLHMDIIDPDLDPVEDFLVNRKSGHCEYFASALALLLRSIDIPARMVNGFKGGDWNDLTQTMNVRQKHAHSWVEAYAGPGPDNTPIWITLDPTPSLGREESIAHVGGIAGNFRPMTDLIRHIWVFYIVGYDRDRQNRLLYAPMRQMIGWVRENLNKIARARPQGIPDSFSLSGPQRLRQLAGRDCHILGWAPSGRHRPSCIPGGSTHSEVVPRSGRRLDLAHGRHPLLSPIGPIARPARAGT